MHISLRVPRPLARLMAVTTAALAVSAGLLAPTAPATAAAGAPVINQNFADPDVMKVGGTYYAFATNSDGRNIKWATSGDLVTWTVQGADALPSLGAWADPGWSFPPGGTGDHGVWAPEVFQTGSNSFVMWYTAHDRASGKQCIGAATATSPGGPYTPRATSFICTPANGGVIDASSFAEGGRRYLLWKNDGNCCAQDTWLRIQEVSADGLTRIGAETALIKQDRAFEGNLVEAPTLWKRGGTYVLFYSANFFGNASYVSSYATSTGLRGPYTKAPLPLMTTDTFEGSVRGPGGQDVVTGPDGRDRIVFHGWNTGYNYRAVYSQELGWTADNLPVARGSKVRHQAEHAALVNAVVRDATGAVDGRVVGHIDFADSRVTFTVVAPRAGTYWLHTRFANGMGTTSTHNLFVNGGAVGTVAYPHTGWDNWQVSSRTVTLNEGTNTISYTRGANFAELDQIEIV